jgi:hypothetical protein
MSAEKAKGYRHRVGAIVTSLILVGPNNPNKSEGVTWAVEVKLLPCGGSEPPTTLTANLFTGGADSWAELEILLSTNRTAMPAFAMTAAQVRRLCSQHCTDC